MKVSALGMVLQNFEEALQISGLNPCNELTDLQKLFVGSEGLAVSQFVTKVQKQLGSRGHGDASEAIKRLQQLLSALSNLLVNAGATTAASDIRRLTELFNGCQFETVAHLIGYLKDKATQVAAPNTGDAIRADLVQSHLRALRVSESDNAEFDRKISVLRADKQVRKEEMREIAKQYLGFEIAKKKGRGPALQEIINHQAVNARQIARGG
jgi:hypothetical protein